MKNASYFLLSLLVLALAACDGGEQIVFKGDVSVDKQSFEEKFLENCKNKEQEMPAYIDKDKYCNCLLEDIEENADKIEVDPNDLDDKLATSVLNYYMNEGMAGIMACADGSMDESKFDWQAQKAEWMNECAGAGAADEMVRYCTCIWDRIKAGMTPREVMQIGDPDNEKVRQYIDECSQELQTNTGGGSGEIDEYID